MKMPRSLFLASLFLALGLSSLSAQNNNNNNNEPPPGWRGYLSIQHPTGQFVMPYSRLVSISRHEYLIDGGGKVYEVTIDTAGSVVARYYFLENALKNSSLNVTGAVTGFVDRAEDVAKSKTGMDTRPVVKHYPNTTHARTTEFNLTNKDDLGKIYDHVIHEWIVQGGKADGKTIRVN